MAFILGLWSCLNSRTLPLRVVRHTVEFSLDCYIFLPRFYGWGHLNPRYTGGAPTPHQNKPPTTTTSNEEYVNEDL